MIRLLAALLLTMGLASALSARAAGTSPDPKDLAIPASEVARARELIKRLGSEVYKEREEAQAELGKMGRLARSALAEAATSDADPEVRYRCARLLPKAGADDLRARLETFLADTNNKYEHDLPGLKQYRKHVGSDEKARALFVEMVKSPYNVELLQAIDKNTTEAGRAISDRRTQLYSQTQMRMIGGRQPVQPQQIGLADIAMLLCAETGTPAKDIPRTGLRSYLTDVTSLQKPASMNVLSGNANQAHSDVYKKIVSGWLESRDDVYDLNQLPYVAGQTLRSFPQAIPHFRKIVAHERNYGYAKGQTLMTMTQIKRKEELPFLKS